MYGCTGVQVPPLSYILFPCSGLCWHALPFSLLLETIGTTWNLYDPRILLDVPCPPVPEMYGCTDVQVPPLHTWQTEKPQLVLGSWQLGSEDIENYGLVRKGESLQYPVSKTVESIWHHKTLELNVWKKNRELKELYGMGRVGLDQHTSTIFNPRLNLKKHPFGTVQSWKNVRKRHPNNR